jgi:hypothetical protein
MFLLSEGCESQTPFFTLREPWQVVQPGVVPIA